MDVVKEDTERVGVETEEEDKVRWRQMIFCGAP